MMSGDILVFQSDSDVTQPLHTMIYVGAGFNMKFNDFLVYHTGKDSVTKNNGMMKIVRIQDLEKHPDHKWRPEEVNPNFKGVYRWKILK